MTDERLYTEHPELYDAIQSEWDYDRDVEFVLERAADHGLEPRRLLEVGCGTGEHTRRFLTEGLAVTAVDRYRGTLEAARGKCDAGFLQGALPDLPVDGRFDLVVALRGVVNHLPPAVLDDALGALAARVADGGLMVLDNSPLPPDGNEPALDVGRTDGGRYVRVARMRPREDGRLAWDSVVFADGDAVVNSRPMTPFDDATVAKALRRRGLDV
ncbi:class I SAM-dependent methyltransferase, partial [Halobacteriales archaeon QS_7_69_60]